MLTGMKVGLKRSLFFQRLKMISRASTSMNEVPNSSSAGCRDSRILSITLVCFKAGNGDAITEGSGKFELWFW